MQMTSVENSDYIILVYTRRKKALLSVMTLFILQKGCFKRYRHNSCYYIYVYTLFIYVYEY